MKLAHIPEGIKWGYPLCCILRFALSGSLKQGRERGVRFTRNGRYIPCNIVHKAQKSWEEVNKSDRNRITNIKNNIS